MPDKLDHQIQLIWSTDAYTLEDDVPFGRALTSWTINVEIVNNC